MFGRVLEQEGDAEEQDQDADAHEDIAIGEIGCHRVTDTPHQSFEMVHRVLGARTWSRGNAGSQGWHV